MFFLLRLTQRVVLTNQTPESGEGALLLLWEQRSQTAPLPPAPPTLTWIHVAGDPGCTCARQGLPGQSSLLYSPCAPGCRPLLPGTL